VTKTIQIVQKLAPGGLETLTLSLSAQLSSRNTIISLEGNENELVSKWPVLNSIKTKIVALDKPDGISLGLIQKLFGVFMRERPKAIITHHIGPLLYAGLAARLCGIKTIVHVEHDAWHLKSTKRLKLVKLAYAVIRPKVVAVSTRVAKELAECGIKNVTVIQNGIDTSVFYPLDKAASRAEFNLPQNVPLYGSAGRLELVKGHDLLLQAFALLPTNSHLVIAGDGSEREALKALALKLGIEKRVHFLGLISNLPVFYSSLDVFILPSRSEGLPLSLLEAQACGVKTAGFNVGGMYEGLCPNTGELVTAEDTKALSYAMQNLFETKSVKSPRDFILETFNLRETVRGYRKIMGDLS
jgi:glycosyltransferase involved in cell wall biosynthesis